MASQPSEAAILEVMAITGIDRKEASGRLKNNANNVSQAVNDYFDNPGAFNTTWDESQFDADRDGGNDSQQPSFQINGMTDYGAAEVLTGMHGVPPSRPPSRNNNTSPIGRVVSSAAETSGVAPYATMNQEDDELQRAIAMSREEAGMPGQEYGVTDENTTRVFGPAPQHKEYADNSWGMIHVPNASLTTPDSLIPAVSRKRTLGVPVALRPTKSNSRLHAIVTILYQIPLIRELMINREQLMSEYGFDPGWWQGKIIKPDVKPAYEIQRLAAFLDMTERSYGSCEALAHFLSKGAVGNLESAFFTKWSASNSAVQDTIFSVARQPGIDGEEDRNQAFALLEFDQPTGSDRDSITTLYDLADSVIWTGSGDEVDGSAFLSSIGQVFCFKLTASPESRSVSIPMVWYPDRYLEANRAAALEMRLRKKQLVEQLQGTLALETKFSEHTMGDGTTVNVRELLEKAIKHASQDNVASAQNEADLQATDPEANKFQHRDLGAELQRMLEKIDHKLDGIKKEKNMALAAMKELSSLLTVPSAEEPLHPYTLRGVSLEANTWLVRCQSDKVAGWVDEDIETANTEGPDEQWWRFQFDSNKLPVETFQYSDRGLEAVLQAGSRDLLLIYASSTAMSHQQQPLPQALEAFVKVDNLSFEGEFPRNLSDDDTHTIASDLVDVGSSPVSATTGKRTFSESGCRLVSSDDEVAERQGERETLPEYEELRETTERWIEGAAVGVEPVAQLPLTSDRLESLERKEGFSKGSAGVDVEMRVVEVDGKDEVEQSISTLK